MFCTKLILDVSLYRKKLEKTWKLLTTFSCKMPHFWNMIFLSFVAKNRFKSTVIIVIIKSKVIFAWQLCWVISEQFLGQYHRPYPRLFCVQFPGKISRKISRKILGSISWTKAQKQNQIAKPRNSSTETVSARQVLLIVQ